MSFWDRLLALTVVVLWGCNFLAIRLGLDHFSPFFFAGLRFAIIAVPVLLFVPRPAVPLRWLLLYGAGFGFAQFAFLFWAMEAGLSWAVGNIATRKAGAADPMRLMLWMCVVPVLPFFGISWFVEGPHAWSTLGTALTTADGGLAPAGLTYVVLTGTIAGTGIYASLLSRYPAGTVAPLSLMVPVVGFTVAWVTLGERPAPSSLIGGVIVIVGALAAQGGRRSVTSRTLLRRHNAPTPVEHSPTWEPAQESPHVDGSHCAQPEPPRGRPRRPDAVRAR